MATFLELVNDLERESGTIAVASRVSDVAAVTGRQIKMVEWVVEAWRLIQLSRADWPWRKREFLANLIVNQSRYTAAELGITKFSGWVKPTLSYSPYSAYDPAVGASAEQPLMVVPFDQWKTKWARGVHSAMRPCDIAFAYDKKLCVGPKPDKAYKLNLEYFAAAQILAVNADVPDLPEEHHGIIVWRAMMLLGDHDEAPTAVATGSAKYQASFRALVDDSFEMAYL